MTARDTPRLRVELACEQLGRSQFVRRCLDVLRGGTEDPQFVVTLGGAHALHVHDGSASGRQDYWLRVWAARGLLWAGPGDDADVLRAALTDSAWRVREMTCKVVARHRVGDLLDDVAALERDSVVRVRLAAARAAARIVEAQA